MLQQPYELRVSAGRIGSMAKLEELIARLRRSIDERERALQGLRQILANFESARDTLSPDALELFERAISLNSTLERTLEGLENKPQRGLLAPREVALAVRDVLLSENRPMKRGEIVSALEKKGVPIPGKDKNKNVGTILWRHPEFFVSLKELGYWLKDKPLPGVYEPEE